jgi:hypothetical protein
VEDDDILELSMRNPGFQFERTASGELIVTPASSNVAEHVKTRENGPAPTGRSRTISGGLA